MQMKNKIYNDNNFLVCITTIIYFLDKIVNNGSTEMINLFFLLKGNSVNFDDGQKKIC